ncbi:MAG: hypothetical protein LC637_01505 [Xanthomonadaceae bacterium]|nr:hypothetical protein [Xanthomonadaceae bacterium]
MSKADQERISGAILELVPQDGSSIGNIKLLGVLGKPGRPWMMRNISGFGRTGRIWLPGAAGADR